MGFCKWTLKKVLGLVLCLAMMLSIMVVGAGAAFTDQSDIDTKHQEAVDACVSLNIITGHPNGSFAPKDAVTREQSAKMICVLLNGGKDPVLGSAVSSFSDVANDRWSCPYIESCVSQDIIVGVGGGKFAPAGKVTGSQLAKMLLVSLGYSPDHQKYAGSAWEVNVNTDASAKGFYDKLEDIDPSQPLSREHAAQMIWNALQANEVEYKSVLTTDENGQLTSKTTVTDRTDVKNNKITLLEDMYDVICLNAILSDVDKANGKDTYTIEAYNTTYNGDEYGTNGYVAYSDVTEDYSNLKYQAVRILVKPEKNGNDAVVLGVYPTGKNTVQTGILKNLKTDGTNKVKLDGTKYSLADNSIVFVNGKIARYSEQGSTSESLYDIYKWVAAYGDGSADKYTNQAYYQPTAVELIANDGTANYSILKVTTYAVGKVSTVGSDYVNISFKKGDNSFTETKCSDSDWNWYDEIAKGDYVLMTDGDNYADGKGMIEKATVVSGKVTAIKSDDQVSVGGEWYTMAGKSPAKVAQPNTGSNVDMVVVDGYVYLTEITEGNVDDVALLVAAAPKGGTSTQWEGRLIFAADGSDKTVSIEKYWDSKDNKSFPIMAFSEGNVANPNQTNFATQTNNTASPYAPMLVTYSVSGDVYTLSRLGINEIIDNDSSNPGDVATNGYDYYASTQGNGTFTTDGSIQAPSGSRHAMFNENIASANGNYDASTSRLYYEDTGVVFVKYNANASGAEADYKVVTGKTAAGYDKDLAGVKTISLANKSGNLFYMQVGLIDLGSGKTGGGDENYLVLTDSVVKDTTDGTMYIATGWDGTQNVTIKTDNSAVKGLSGGALITYSGDVNNADVEVKTTTNCFVEAYDSGSGDIRLHAVGEGGIPAPARLADDSSVNRTVVDSKDTKVLYVSSTDGEGVAPTEIERAFWYDADFWKDGTIGSTDEETGKYNLTEDIAPNVSCFFDDEDFITVIIVDVNRNITEW